MRFLTNDECAEWTILNAYPIVITGRTPAEPGPLSGNDFHDSECPVGSMFADAGLTPYRTGRSCQKVQSPLTSARKTHGEC